MTTIKLQGPPSTTTPGSVGDIFINTLTGEEYKCTFAYKNPHLGVAEFEWRPTGNVRRTPTIDIPVAEEEIIIENEPEPVKPEKPRYTNYSKHSKKNK